MLIPCHSEVFSVLDPFRRLLSMHSFRYDKYPCFPTLKLIFSNSTFITSVWKYSCGGFLLVVEISEAEKHVDTLSIKLFHRFGPFSEAYADAFLLVLQAPMISHIKVSIFQFYNISGV